MRLRQEDEFSASFWELNGARILDILAEDGVVLLNYEDGTQNDKARSQVLAELFYQEYPLERLQEGIAVLQYRYMDQRGHIKTKWLSGKKWIKKNQKLLAFCCWIFTPVRIKPRKTSYRPEDQQFEYQMYLWEYAAARPKTEVKREEQTEAREINNSFQMKIATTWKGLPLGKIRAKGTSDSEFPYKFAFPKAVVAKINRILAKYYWPVLWREQDYFAWHRIDENFAMYMGTRKGDPKPSYRELLHSLLENDQSGAAATLLSFTCFSVLKPFFPHYHALEADTSYLKAKKYIPRQVALCVRSDPPYLAQMLASLCCGCFEMYKKFPVLDGIVFQENTGKVTKLSENEFEARVLQPACVLWINRMPESTLLEDGRVIQLQAQDDTRYTGVKLFSFNLIAHLTDRIELRSRKQENKFWKENWKEALPLLDNFLCEVTEIAEKCRHDLGEIDLKSELYQMSTFEDILSPMSVLDRLMYLIRSDTYSQLDDVIYEIAIARERRFLNEVNAVYKRYRTQIRHHKKENTARLFLFTKDYENALLEFKPYSKRFGKELVRKFAFLLAASEVFVRLCFEEQNRAWLRDKFRSGLETVLLQQKKEVRASDILEEYIVQTISAGRCARIRGKGSDRADLWYDPREKIFLLPGKSYFPMIESLLAEGSITKADFEQRLANEGTILIIQRKEQVRRTFEVKVRAGGGRVSCLKAVEQKFSKKFFSNSKIRTALEEMSADKSSFRAHSTEV